ncbi:MAG: hypothetical protein HQ581_23740 [Planctomycetes bacterium]|nr:hypothetical protein [Planctomycetota bacterium]
MAKKKRKPTSKPRSLFILDAAGTHGGPRPASADEVLTPILAALDDVSTNIAELLPIEGNDQTTHRREGTEANRAAAAVTRTAVQKLRQHLQLCGDPDFGGMIWNASLSKVQNIGVARVRQTIDEIDSWFNGWFSFETAGELEAVPDFPAALLDKLTSAADALHRLGSAVGAEPDGEEFALQENDVNILRVLLEFDGVTLLQSRIGDLLAEARKPISNKPLGQRLGVMRKAGYTNRPRGPKSGEAITDKGRKALSELEKGPPNPGG